MNWTKVSELREISKPTGFQALKLWNIRSCSCIKSTKIEQVSYLPIEINGGRHWVNGFEPATPSKQNVFPVGCQLSKDSVFLKTFSSLQPEQKNFFIVWPTFFPIEIRPAKAFFSVKKVDFLPVRKVNFFRKFYTFQKTDYINVSLLFSNMCLVFLYLV